MLKGVTNVCRVFGFIAGLCFFVASLVVTYETCARYLGSPTSWAQDVAVYLMIYGAFLCQAAVMIDDSHVRVDLIIGQMSPQWRKACVRYTLLLGMIYVAVLGWSGGGMTYLAYHFHRMSTGLFRIPIWIPEFAIPLGCALLLLAMAVRVVQVRMHNMEQELEDHLNL
jgi:TRAP-type C4-dicarboxylate transport system permease small subunit